MRSFKLIVKGSLCCSAVTIVISFIHSGLKLYFTGLSLGDFCAAIAVAAVAVGAILSGEKTEDAIETHRRKERINKQAIISGDVLVASVRFKDAALAAINPFFSRP
jgi:hypothetical protein